MRRFARLQPGLSAARTHFPAARLYATKGGNIDACTAGQSRGVAPAPLDADEPDIEALFNFGESLAGIDHHNKKIKTTVGSLPLSPLLDPTWRKARKPHKKKQPPPTDRMPRFQRNIKLNAYAQLLAEPVRQCHVTRSRLPRSFLQGFGLVKHPETQALWWIPAGFEKATTTSAVKTSDKAEPQTVNEDETMSSSEPMPTEYGTQIDKEISAAADLVDPAAEESSPAKQKDAFRAPAHVLARQDLLMEFLDKKSKHGGGQYRFAIIKSMADKVGKATWRPDMHVVVREHLLRRAIVDHLIAVSQMCETGERDWLVTVQAPEDSLKHQNRNCFFRLTGKYTPFDYLEVPGVLGSARPVYHLPELLGQGQFQRLKDAVPLFSNNSLLREGSLVLLKGKPNVEVNKKLWKLQGFLADYVGLNGMAQGHGANTT